MKVGAMCAAALTVASLAVGGCRSGQRQREPVERSWPVMGTIATLHVAGGEAADLSRYADAVKQVFAEMETTLSVYNPESEISRLNCSAGGAAVAISGHTHEVMEISRAFAARTRGCFDPTVGPVVRLWGFSGGTKPDRAPDDAAIREAMSHIGFGKVVFSADGHEASLGQAGMFVDMGGIAKGYAVDVARDALLKLGARNVLVDLAGNMRAIGSPRAGGVWRVGVRNPFDRAAIVGAIGLPAGAAVATSGNYERFVEIGGVRYAHIMDPRTGRPVTGMAGVTVVCPTAVETDAMSTGLFVLGVREGMEVLRTLPECHALFIPDEQPMRILITPGMKALFTPLPEFAAAVVEVEP